MNKTDKSLAIIKALIYFGNNNPDKITREFESIPSKLPKCIDFLIKESPSACAFKIIALCTLDKDGTYVMNEDEISVYAVDDTHRQIELNF